MHGLSGHIDICISRLPAQQKLKLNIFTFNMKVNHPTTNSNLYTLYYYLDFSTWSFSAKLE